MMSQIDMNREKLMEAHVLLPLIELLRSDDDVLLLSVAKALINLSSGNVHAKDSIVNEGGVRTQEYPLKQFKSWSPTADKMTFHLTVSAAEPASERARCLHVPS